VPIAVVVTFNVSLCEKLDKIHALLSNSAQFQTI